MAYATAADLKLYAGIEANTDDGLLTLLLARAQAAIDLRVGFAFEASSDTTRYFDAAPTSAGGHVDGRLLLFDTWCASITSVTNGDGTVIASTYYVTEPRNGSRYYGIRLLASSGYTWEAQTDDDTEKAITIVGIANAVVSIMMIPVTAFPFGKELIDRDDPRALYMTSLVSTR